MFKWLHHVTIGVGVVTCPGLLQLLIPDDPGVSCGTSLPSGQLFFRRLGAWDCYTSGLPHPRCNRKTMWENHGEKPFGQ